MEGEHLGNERLELGLSPLSRRYSLGDKSFEAHLLSPFPLKSIV
jgi:hypothetical protein